MTKFKIFLAFAADKQYCKIEISLYVHLKIWNIICSGFGIKLCRLDSIQLLLENKTFDIVTIWYYYFRYCYHLILLFPILLHSILLPFDTITFRYYYLSILLRLRMPFEFITNDEIFLRYYFCFSLSILLPFDTITRFPCKAK